jgi:hypothetical protein
MEGDEVLRTAGSGAGAGTGANGLRIKASNVTVRGLIVNSFNNDGIEIYGTINNVTIAGKSNVLTPSLPAAQPATYKLNGETVRPLGRENDKAFALVNALDRSSETGNFESGRQPRAWPGEDGKTIQPEGIKASALNAAQQQLLLDLVHEWVGILNDEAAAAKMAEIKANLTETWFAWSGPTTNGSAAYFRIQGPTLLIEYSPQGSRGNSGPDLNHIHTIYRDPTNDYGARLVMR